jgi:hypothetical protein
MVFEESAGKFLSFINTDLETEYNVSLAGIKNVGIVVMPWVQTSVPWFSLTIGMLLDKLGHNITIINDDLKQDQETKIIKNVLENLPKYRIIELLDVEDSVLDEGDKSEIKRLSKLNSIWKFRSTITNGKMVEFENRIEADLRISLKKIKSVVSSHAFDLIICPGGIYGNSSLYVYMGKILNTRVATYDSGNGSMLIGIDDVASHQMDIRKMFPVNYSDKVKSYLFESARIEKEKRLIGKDQYSYQSAVYSPEGVTTQYDILMPLNIAWDAAALGKHCFFANSYEWILETADFILNKTNASLAIRQHPFERMFAVDNLEQVLVSRFGDNPRFRFYSCKEEISTYNILEKAKLVLPHTSTIGIEASMIGKKVIVESSCYYSTLDFVQKASSKDDYFEKILAATGKFSECLGAQTENEDSFYCYCFTLLNRVITNFTPQPPDFDGWVQTSLSQLLINPEVIIMLKSMVEGTPIARIQLEKRMEERFQ